MLNPLAVLRNPAGALGMFPQLLGAAGPGARLQVGTLLELAAGADDLVATPPAVFMPLFRRIGEAHDLPAELLAAIAAVQSRYNPASTWPCRSGLMGVPHELADGADVVARVQDLAAGDRDAIAAVRRNVELAGAELARLRKLHVSGLAGALLEYARAGAYAGAGEPVDLVASIAAQEIIGVYVLLVARQLDGERLRSVQGAMADA